MDARGVVEFLKIRVAEYPSHEKAAQAAGLGIDHLSQVLNGRSTPGPKVLKWLGLRRVFSYEPDGKLR